MTIPSVILGFIISSLLGALFHIWQDGGAGRFLVYLVASWSGFWIGHILGNFLPFTFFKLGPINLGTALIVCIAFLGLGHWLSLVEDKA
jgi:hypothetical protein